VLVPGKSHVKVQPEILDIFFLGELHVVYMDWWGGGGAHFSSCGGCDVDRFGPVSFYSPLFKPVLDCSFVKQWLELSMASTAVLSAKVAVVYSGEVGRYNGHRALPLAAPALTGESSAYSVSAFTRKCLLCK
jgi:hypothetical protein